MRIEQLTFTRFLAAIGIVFCHFARAIPPFNTGILHTITINAKLGVGYFFVLSGFVMVVAYHRGGKPINTGSYYLKRLAKIYPMYLLCLLAMLFFAPEINAGKLTSELLLVHAFFPQHIFAYNWTDWSLSVEFLFYLLFPLLYNYFYLKKGFKVVGISILSFWLLSQCLIFAWPYFAFLYNNIPFHSLKYGPFFHLNEFFAGNFIGLYFIKLSKTESRTDRRRLLLPLLLLIPFAIALLIAAKVYSLKPMVNLHNGLLLIIYLPFILFLALNKGWLSHILASKPLVFAGEISYCIYILQVPVFALSGMFITFQNPALNFYSSLALLLVASALAYTFIEEPVRRFVNKRLATESK